MVMFLDSWVTMAKPSQTLDTEPPPSEAFEREDFVVVMGETVGRKTQRFLPILRTDAGGFFGFGDLGAMKFDGIEGRFAGMLPPKETTPEMRAVAQALLAAMGVTDANGHLQMPGSRVLSPGTPDGPRWYWANTRSEACPSGFNTEDTIKEIWNGASK